MDETFVSLWEKLIGDMDEALAAIETKRTAEAKDNIVAAMQTLIAVYALLTEQANGS